jgi:glycine oxidase
MFAVIDVPAGRPTRLVHAPLVYVAPRSNGRLLVGATEEEGATDSAVDPVAISLLRAAAERALPGLALGRVESAWTGVRPATPDGAPIFDRVGEGVVLAAGHHRNGVLLAPISGRIAADLAEGGACEAARGFGAGRFVAEGALTSG